MNVRSYEFTVKNLYYRSIEIPITRHYGLGAADESDIPPHLSKENNIGSYYIACAKGKISFDLEITERTDGAYDLTCYSVDIKRKRK